MERKFTPGWTSLEAAKLLFREGYFYIAASQAYYAMYEMTTELFAKSNLQSSKSHHGLQVLFSQHFIKTNLIDSFYSNALGTVERIRLVADYNGDRIIEDDAAKAIDLAEKFVTEISAYISKLV